MGLANASQKFQQMIDDCLQPVRDIATPYIDDILIGTRVDEGENLFEKHFQDVQRVLDVLKEEQLICDIKKVPNFC